MTDIDKVLDAVSDETFDAFDAVLKLKPADMNAKQVVTWFDIADGIRSLAADLKPVRKEMVSRRSTLRKTIKAQERLDALKKKIAEREKELANT